MKTREEVEKYAGDFIEALCDGKVDADMQGDCLYCMARCAEGPDKGKPMGECMGDTTHIDSHIEEPYYVGSLLVRACEQHSHVTYVTAIATILSHGEVGTPLYMQQTLEGVLRDHILKLYGIKE